MSDGPFWWHAEEEFRAREDALRRGVEDEAPSSHERGRYASEDVPSQSELKEDGR
jgi:hypothetical protein